VRTFIFGEAGEEEEPAALRGAHAHLFRILSLLFFFYICFWGFVLIPDVPLLGTGAEQYRLASAERKGTKGQGERKDALRSCFCNICEKELFGARDGKK
jgi:hypothetical protein